jgi:bifunctional pyridoxal-dependent enzyme with beta-cystathionase and maltose regulon repressor activities
MTIAIWIIAVCEVIRAIQNMIQIMAIRHDTGARDNAYAEFVKSLKQTDREFVRRMLEEFESEVEE